MPRHAQNAPHRQPRWGGQLAWSRQQQPVVLQALPWAWRLLQVGLAPVQVLILVLILMPQAQALALVLVQQRESGPVAQVWPLAPVLPWP